MESKVRARAAAHCPTCAAKLEGGLKLWQPVSLSELSLYISVI